MLHALGVMCHFNSNELRSQQLTRVSVRGKMRMNDVPYTIPWSEYEIINTFPLSMK